MTLREYDETAPLLTGHAWDYDENFLKAEWNHQSRRIT